VAEDPTGFQAYTPIDREADVIALLDASLKPLGFGVVDDEPKVQSGFHRQYVAPSGALLPCRASVAAGWTDRRSRALSKWSFYPLSALQIENLSSEQYRAAIAAACIGTDAILGRTFHASGLDRITQAELLGAPDMVTWLQYFGPDMSAHIGVNRLRSAPFYSVEFYPNGAHLARTAEAHGDVWPWHERRPLLDHLGLVPRRLYIGRQQDEEIRWCEASDGAG
jgi:hypothetical protein